MDVKEKDKLFLSDSDEDKRIDAALMAKCAKVDEDAAWNAVKTRLRKKHVFHYANLWWAAVVVLVVGSAVFWATNQFDKSEQISEVVLPGTQKAYLHLSTGEKIVLGKSSGGLRGKEGGVDIEESGDSLLTYSTQVGIEGTEVYNTIEVPNGGEYMLLLSDGTRVWLNADSKLVYPIKFCDSYRTVKLEGEGFFEVAENKNSPFTVQTDNFNVVVTGTKFNVKAYEDEVQSAVLVEGGVRVENSHGVKNVLQAGEQLLFDNGKTKIVRPDMQEVLAWRSEAFYYKNRRAEDIFNELSRWYDLSVFYQSEDVKSIRFTAWFSRSASIEEVLNVLAKTGKIDVSLKSKTLIISRI